MTKNVVYYLIQSYCENNCTKYICEQICLSRKIILLALLKNANAWLITKVIAPLFKKVSYFKCTLNTVHKT